MANIGWCESPNALDCLADGEWDLMVTYIKHSAVTDFTIYETEGTCADTGQAFRFTKLGALSTMVGGADAGDDLLFLANDTDNCALLKLYGNGDIINKIEATSNFEVDTCTDETLLVVSATAFTYKGTDVCLAPCGGSSACPVKGDLPFELWDDCTTENESLFLFQKNGTQSRIRGGDVTGDQFQIFANQVDAYPYFHMLGDASIRFYTKTTVNFYKELAWMFKISMTGTVTELTGGADAGDDLKIIANSNDNCSLLELLGDGSATIKVKAGSLFEVSTCSDETLFEVSSASGNHHVDFHCLDAVDFVLENRTDDPGSPCTGQIWFRTDLV